MRKTVALAVSLCALTVAGAANAAEPSAPVALTDEQMDRVVAGDATVPKQDPAPGVIVVESGEGATLLTSVQSSVHPPPVILLNVDGEFEVVNLTALVPPSP